jgi:CRP/FNR family transcriptional regulator, nitrogen oxide reductase regulator
MLIVGTAMKLQSRFLGRLTLSDRKTILATARQRHFPANAVIVNQGDPAKDLFLLIEGRARFFFSTPEGKKVVLLWLTPGEIFGGSAILSMPCTYLVGTETLRESSLLMWDRATLRRLAARYPMLLDNLSLIAYKYLDWYVADHFALIGHNARQRLVRILVSLAKGIGKKVADGLEFDATNDELASAANVTQFTVSRLLSEWQRNRAISKRRGRVVLRLPDRLSPQTG